MLKLIGKKPVKGYVVDLFCVPNEMEPLPIVEAYTDESNWLDGGITKAWGGDTEPAVFEDKALLHPLILNTIGTLEFDDKDPDEYGYWGFRVRRFSGTNYSQFIDSDTMKRCAAVLEDQLRITT